MRLIEKRGFFLTANGQLNTVQLEKRMLIITTSKKEAGIKISRDQIRKGIRHMQVYRTLIRKDLEGITAFTSALLGILIEIFKSKSKLLTLKNGLYRLSLLGVRFYASGLEKDPFLRKVYKDLGGKYVLFNYYQLLQSSFDWEKWLIDHEMFCVIDSGSYSYYQKKKKINKASYKQQELFSEEDLTKHYINGYADFINRHKHNTQILGFFPFDCIGDPQQTKWNYEILKSKTDANIFPVWQMTDSLDELQKLVDEEPEMIGFGGSIQFLSNRLDKVRSVLQGLFKRFENVNFHLLGVANELLLEFPCFSADSTAYINARKSAKQRQCDLYL